MVYQEKITIGKATMAVNVLIDEFLLKEKYIHIEKAVDESKMYDLKDFVLKNLSSMYPGTRLKYFETILLSELTDRGVDKKNLPDAPF